MTRTYQVALAGLALSAVVAGLTGADHLIDRRYDQAIASAGQIEPQTWASRVRLVVQQVNSDASAAPRVHAAATEHVWLTNPPAAVSSPLAAELAAPIATAVGARFTISYAGQTQILEVVDVRAVADNHLALTASAVPAQLILVSCKVVTGASTTTDHDRLVRFLVDAAEYSAPAAPRAL
jgi:hypothetical protein